MNTSSFSKSVLEQATAAANTAVGDVITNHANIFNRDIRTKSLELDPQGIATKNFSMGEQYHIAGLPDPIFEHEAANLRILQTVISQNNMRELSKYLRHDGSSEPTNDLTMSDNPITNLANPTSPKDVATKKYVDDLITNPVGTGPNVASTDLDVNNFKITNLKNPTDGQGATNRRFVERNFVRKDQDINMKDHKVTGLDPLDVTQSDQSDAAPKGYVDREIFRQIDENNRVEAVTFLNVDGTSLPEANQDFIGQKLKNLGQPVDPNDAATVNSVDYRIVQRTFHVNLEGAQEKLKMNNNVICGLANPTERNDTTHKFYVDSHDEYRQRLVTKLTRQVEGLQTRVVILERLSHSE